MVNLWHSVKITDPVKPHGCTFLVRLLSIGKRVWQLFSNISVFKALVFVPAVNESIVETVIQFT